MISGFAVVDVFRAYNKGAGVTVQASGQGGRISRQDASFFFLSRKLILLCRGNCGLEASQTATKRDVRAAVREILQAQKCEHAETAGISSQRVFHRVFGSFRDG